MSKQGKRSDAKAIAAIEGAGWTFLAAEGRHVATKNRYHRDDESVTRMFESDRTLEGLARAVARREREEGFKS